ncbi:glutamine synthetase [Oceanicola sp. D3]|uniref:glutamine synthetase family protein n=1 Tax=Oceanicola sp. D3 TaxID=2587163 RepID=UPI001122B68D|nr:glutamine synthetase family protein [Oceanicola sp. D3]QDC10037.1 glutamine synthetase [Oceanicola sp. D3]
MKDRLDKIANGRLAQEGLLSPEAVQAASELVERLSGGETETVRVLFADQNGILRGKTVVASALESVFCSGLAAPSTLILKDTSNRTAFPIWAENNGIEGELAGGRDLLMVPDPATFRVLPWSPHSAWIFCDPYFKSGAPIAFSPRGILKVAMDRLAKHGLAMQAGLEVEFHVFELLDDKMAHSDATMPATAVTTRNLSRGYQFLSGADYDRLEPVMDDLRRNCQALGLPVRSTEVEMGPSQFEFTFDPADPLTHADNMMMFRAMVKESCARKGLHATFMCKPAVANSAASGWHLHQSLVDTATGENLMIPPAEAELSDTASAWIAGLLEHAAQTCLLTTPTVNGYKRYRPHQLAPDRIQWGRDNRGAMIRAMMAPGDPASRVENRVAETTANPYYYFASQILCGLDGIERGLRAPEPVETPYDSDAPALPNSLLSAIQHFEASDFYRAALGDTFVDYIATLRRSEWERYHLTVSEWEQAEYFGLF